MIGKPTTLGDYVDDYIRPEPLNADKIRGLRLRNTNIGDEGVQNLLEWHGSAELECLDISQCRIQDEATYLQLTKLQKLKQLGIAGNSVPVSAIAAWGGIRQLVTLELPQVTDAESFAVLFPQPSAKLKRLSLVGAKSLVKVPHVVAGAAEQFAELKLGSTSIGDNGMSSILASSSVKSVVELNVSKCSLSDKGIKSLVELELARLVVLDISSNKLTDESLQMLANSRSIRNLTHLRTRNNRKLSVVGFQALMDQPDFRPVRFDVGKCKNEAMKSALRERFGDALVAD